MSDSLKPATLHNEWFTARNNVWWYGGTVVTHHEAYHTPHEQRRAAREYIRHQLTKALPVTSVTRWRKEIATAGGLPAVLPHLNPAQMARFQLLNRAFGIAVC